MNIAKLNPKQFLVLYEHFFERDCFGDGDWSNNYEIFMSKKESLDFISNRAGNNNYRNFVGPLKLA